LDSAKGLGGGRPDPPASWAPLGKLPAPRAGSRFRPLSSTSQPHACHLHLLESERKAGVKHAGNKAQQQMRVIADGQQRLTRNRDATRPWWKEHGLPDRPRPRPALASPLAPQGTRCQQPKPGLGSASSSMSVSQHLAGGKTTSQTCRHPLPGLPELNQKQNTPQCSHRNPRSQCHMAGGLSGTRLDGASPASAVFFSREGKGNAV
jgi:hypothetical protein